eukprot:COSAG01_NODE_2483_length_7600_cov_4.742034_9_plen_72_part_00
MPACPRIWQCAAHTAKSPTAACEVTLPRGMYWYAGGMHVPRATSLVGEATELVSLFFYEQVPTVHPVLWTD